MVAEMHERCRGATITSDLLPRGLTHDLDAAARPRVDDAPIDLQVFLDEIERAVIQRALQKSRGNKARAARLLSMTRPKLYRRMEQLGLIAGEGDDSAPDNDGDPPDGSDAKEKIANSNVDEAVGPTDVSG